MGDISQTMNGLSKKSAAKIKRLHDASVKRSIKMDLGNYRDGVCLVLLKLS